LQRKTLRQIHEQADACITLYQSKRDALRSRHGKGNTWTEALDRFNAANAVFQSGCAAFRDAERAYFAKRAKWDGDLMWTT